MIQRIQSVYLLLVAILLGVTAFSTVGTFVIDNVTPCAFKPLGVTMADGGFQSTWGLFGILLLAAIDALCTIFLFRNRMLHGLPGLARPQMNLRQQQCAAHRLLHCFRRILLFAQRRSGGYWLSRRMGLVSAFGLPHPQLPGIPCHLSR